MNADLPAPLVPAEVDLLAQLHAEFERASRIRPLAENVRSAFDWRARLRSIERYYRAVEADIDASPCDVWAFDPYEVDWPMLFTPIEASLWSEIRSLGLVLYPQFPVRVTVLPDDRFTTFFTDFANPKCRVAIECDGKAFHDPCRDRERDEAMKCAGWRVFRFTGAQCRDDFNEETMQHSTVARALERIARDYMQEPRDFSRQRARA